MKTTLILFKGAYRDGHHLNSKYWQEWKKQLPGLPSELTEVAVGMVLSDACMYKVSTEALIKFEQGYLQEGFLLHLFDIFKSYCFMEEPGRRVDLNGPRKGLTKSLWFKTFSHYSFTAIWNLFYKQCEGKVRKTIHKGLVLNHLTPLGLAYWVMEDGSLQKDRKTMILHTQSYTKPENIILSEELNTKFGFTTEVISHKEKYFCVKFNSKDALLLHNLIKPYMHSSMAYKIPKV